MPRSSTSFKPGNKFAAKKGDRLAVTHGAYSQALIEQELPAKMEELYRQHPFWIEGDSEAVRSAAYACIQADRLRQWLENEGEGRLFDRRTGKPRGVYLLWKELEHSKREWMKILAMGPMPRAQYAQAMSGAGKNMVEVRSGLKSLHSELQQ